jgi:hypothetical protein
MIPCTQLRFLLCFVLYYLSTISFDPFRQSSGGAMLGFSEMYGSLLGMLVFESVWKIT